MIKIEFEKKLENEIGLVEYELFSFDEVTNDFHLFIWFDMLDEFIVNRNTKLIKSLEMNVSFDENTFCTNLKPNDFPKMKLNVYRKNKKIRVECEEDLNDNLRFTMYQVLKKFFERIFKNFGLN